MSWKMDIQIAVYMAILAFITAAWGYQKGYKEGRAFQRKITHKFREKAVNYGSK